ncbi:MAG: EpsI family protein [Polaromonas sp.]|nr:EpsI family protein [Polaromonas sp.]
MNRSLINWGILLLMLVSASLGLVLRPTMILADKLPLINLQKMVPIKFGDWEERFNASNQVINPKQEMLDSIYNEVLSRTYVNSTGYQIMLSIAYGKSQNDSVQLHKPEVCYPAEGFEIKRLKLSTLEIFGTSISVTRLETKLGQRFEPLTYWTVVGDQNSTGGINKKLIEISYAKKGYIPDGMLIRVSSIDKSPTNAYANQTEFSQAMITAIAPEHRSRFAGSSKSK